MLVSAKPVLDQRVGVADLLSRAITSPARLATMAAASCSPGTTVCWASAASMAVAATASALRTLRFPNQAASRAAPARRRRPGLVAGEQDQRGLGGL